MGRASIWVSLSLALVACGGTEVHGTRPGIDDTDACATCSAGSGGKGHGGASGDSGLGTGGRGSDSTDGSVASPVDAGGPVSGSACNLTSGYAGDDTCILPPAPAAGFQLHYGPAGYDDPDAVARYLLSPGDETDDCVFVNSPNAAKAEIAAAHLRMRPGIYLFSVDLLATTQTPGGGPVPCGGGTSLLTAIGSANEIAFSRTDGAPENQGVALPVLGRAPLALHVHAINTTDQATLKEAWANADVTDASTVTTEAFPLTFLGGLAMNIPPGQTQIVTAGGVSCASTAQADVRILSLLSETHSSTTRSSTTIVRASGPAERVYENYSWSDPFRARFDTVTANPAPNGASRTSGGASGVLLVHPGDQLAWECEILNDTPGSITYANRLFGSEVCNVRGYVADASGPLRCISN